MRFPAKHGFITTLILLVGSCSVLYAQEIIPPIDQLQSSDCTQDLYNQAEKLYLRGSVDSNTTSRAEQLISKMMATCRFAESDQHLQSELDVLHETRAEHNFLIAKYYFDQFKNGKPGFKGAQSRFIQITTKYPHFSRIDEVLLLLSETYIYDDNCGSAKTVLEKLINDFPTSTVRGNLEADLQMVRTNLDVCHVIQGPPPPETIDGSSKP